MQRYNLTIEPLTVMHIGTGSKIEPHEYTVCENKKNPDGLPLYLRIDFERIFENITEEKVKQRLFDVLTKSSDFVKFRTALQKELPDYFEAHFMYGCHATYDFQEEFNQKYSNPNNELAVLEMYRPLHSKYSKLPFLPGSSIKGALRTAILNKLANELNPARTEKVKQGASKALKWKVDKEFQQALLDYSDAKEDPFRTIQISDGKVQGKRPVLVGIAYNYSIKNGIPRDSTIPIYLEVVRGIFAEGDAKIQVTLSINRDLVPASKAFHKNHPDGKFKRIPFEIELQTIINACNAFYKKVWEGEFKKYFIENSNNADLGIWESLNREISKIGSNPNEFLLRIGRFSHFEAVTVEKFRPRKVYGKSRTLFAYKDNLFPMGWAKVTLNGV